MDERDIPFGDYCYEMLSFDQEKCAMNVKYCPYLKEKIDPEWNEERCFCSLIGAFDILLDDQVKICGINDDISPEEEKEWLKK